MKRVNQNESLANKYKTTYLPVYMLGAFVIECGIFVKILKLVLSVQNMFLSNIPMPPGPGNSVEPSNFMRLRNDSSVMYKNHAAAVGHLNAISCFPTTSLSKRVFSNRAINSISYITKAHFKQ